ADRYREAVRTTLYPGLSAAQLEALIATLLIVRKQSVTDNLSPALLHDLLTEGLPPLDETEIAKVARGFEDLDRRRDTITEMEADVEAVRALDAAVRRYARAVVAREAAAVRSAETRRDDVTRREREASAAHEQALHQQRTLRDQDRERETAIDEAEGRLAGLRASRAYTHGSRELHNARRIAEQAEAAARDADARAAHDEADAADAAEHAATLAGQSRTAADQLGAAAIELRRLAARVGVAAAVEGTSDADAGAVADGPLRARRDQVAQMRRAVEAQATAVADRERAAEAVDVADDALRTATSALEQTRRREGAALSAWQGALVTWRQGLVELDPAGLDGLDAVTEPSAAVARAAAAHTAVVETLAAASADLRAQRDALATRRDTLQAERADLEAGTDRVPDAPAWRSPRQERAGASLWRLVDFADHLEPAARDRVEAALLASGLLDAWVEPAGGVTLPDAAADVVLDAGQLDGLGGAADARPATADDTLAGVLVAVDGTDVPAAVTTRILAGVALVPAAAHRAGGTAVIGRDGTFRLGRLTGRGPDTAAAHVGATARAQARARRITAIDAELAEVAGLETDVDRRLVLLDERRRVADRERAGLPAGDEVVAARRDLDRAEALADAAKARLADAEAALDTAEQRAAAALKALSRLASTTGLPTDGDALERVRDDVDGALRHAGLCVERAARAAETAAAAQRAAGDAARRQATAESSRSRAGELARTRAKARHEFDALEAAIGEDVRQVQTEIDGLDGALAEQRAERRRIAEQLEAAAGAVGRTQQTLATATEERERADAAREAARGVLVAALADGLADDAGIDVADLPTDTATGVLTVARRIAEQTGGVDTATAALGRLRSRVEERLHTTGHQVAGRVDVSFEPCEQGHDWMVLRARVDGTAYAAPQLRALLADRLEVARAELTAREEEVFAQTLTGSVRAHLATRIRAARSLVDAMNTLLAQVRTAASGVRVELAWDVDGALDDRALLTRIRTLLLGERHDPAEQAELHDFLRRQIERVRATDAAASSWQDRLTAILDYRHWHRFTVRVHHDRYGDRPVTFGSRKVQLSAGEKTVALTLPLIAAVAAHYLPRDGGRAPACPRLLLMDELFPKVDRANKRQLLGLLPQLDLDAVFTSDKDWCDYDTLDAIAIHFVQKDGDDSYTTRFVWNGRQRQAAPVSGAQADVAGPMALDLGGDG
ncbi:MAG TPA: TIGR02680 family protein, partial [Solirubrobacteraceae bacterium]|nr:TIGR02680 family protein [Solirubrobacteraceae bacterium]